MASKHNELLDLIYGAVADPDRWPEILTRISDHIGAIGGMLVYNAPPGGRSVHVLGRLSEEYSALYLRHYVWNPWTLAMKDMPFGKAVVANSLVESGTIARTGLYADVLAPQGIVDMISASHRAMAQDGGVGGFNLQVAFREVELDTSQALWIWLLFGHR